MTVGRTVKQISMHHKLLAIVVISMFLTVVYYKSTISNSSGIRLVVDKKKVHLYRYNKVIIPSSQRVCTIPQLEIENKEIARLLSNEIEVKCTAEKNWVYVDNGTFVISREAVSKHGTIVCAFTSLLRGSDDFTWHFGPVVKPFKNGTLIPTDFFNVTCYGSDKTKYVNVHEAISYQPDLHKIEPNKRLLPSSIGTNVLILGLDSVSRMMWLRKLKRTRTLLMEEFGAIELQGANVMGDGTPAATFPLLTGKTEEELPESRRKIPGAVPLDDFPFIFKDFKRIGYLTQMAEDYSDVAMFTYRLRGFDKQPTDHFARPYYLVTEEKYSSNPKPHCTGSEPNSVLDLNWISDTYKMYPNKLKFMFHFLAEFTHSRGRVLFEHADKEIAKFLRKFKKGGHLNNTIIVVMSDHGSRFSELRESVQGKQEERLPYVSITFPPWFKSKFNKAYENVVKNSQGLTTVNDIHETLLDVISFRTDEIGILSNRGISLFREIPLERTCADAGISEHWCTCLDWHTESTESVIIKRIATEAVAYMNTLLKPASEYCEQLSIDKITKAYSLVPNNRVLAFKQASDADGRVGDFSAKTMVDITTFQIALTTAPNNGRYELSVRYEVKSQRLTFDKNFISRTNKYGEDPRCIMELFTQLRKFCLCKKKE